MIEQEPFSRTFRPNHLRYRANRKSAVQDGINRYNSGRHDLSDRLSSRSQRGGDSVCQGSFDLGTEVGGGSHSIRLIFAYRAMMYKWQMQGELCNRLASN